MEVLMSTGNSEPLELGVQNFKYQSSFINIFIHSYVALMLVKLLIPEHSAKVLKMMKG